jgi:hypothetical protein
VNVPVNPETTPAKAAVSQEGGEVVGEERLDKQVMDAGEGL